MEYRASAERTSFGISTRFELLDVADHTFYHFNVNAAYFEQLLNSWSAFMVEQGIWEYNEGMDAGLLG